MVIDINIHFIALKTASKKFGLQKKSLQNLACFLNVILNPVQYGPTDLLWVLTVRSGGSVEWVWGVPGQGVGAQGGNKYLMVVF